MKINPAVDLYHPHHHHHHHHRHFLFKRAVHVAHIILNVTKYTVLLLCTQKENLRYISTSKNYYKSKIRCSIS